MTSKPVALLLADLGITRTHSRPHVSNDNPFSEAQFKTLKYRPEFPDRFRSLEAARAFCHPFFTWYNTAQRHGGIGLLTPAMVHHGHAEGVRTQRAAVLAAAYAAHPERFVRQPPQPPALPAAVWINPPPPSETPATPSGDTMGLPASSTIGSGSTISSPAPAMVPSRAELHGRQGDVFDEEPLPVDHPLCRLPNTVITPHLGYVTEETFRVFCGHALEDIQAYLRGEPIRVLGAWRSH